MVLRRFLRFFLLLFTTAILPVLGTGVGLTAATGCTGTSGASAPPVSLPAPVSGRLTVTSPDEDGVALVIGDDGAVPADSLVHAVNNTRATSSLSPRLIDLLAILEETLLVSTADAQSTLPALCSRSFHGCAVADSAGSFEIEIQASDDDDIGVEIIDASSGTVLSGRTNRPVPRNIRFFVRPILNVALWNDPPSGTRNLYALMGRTVDDPNGLISIVDLNTNARHVVSFVGALPFSMAVHPDTQRGAVVDALSNLVVVADLVAETFNAPLSTPVNQPLDIVFTTNGNRLIVATAGLNALLQFNTATLATVAEIGNANLSAFIPETSNTETVAIDLVRVPVPGFDLIAFVGNYDVDGTETPLLGLLNDDFGLMALTPLPAGTEPRDVVFYRTENRLLVSDAGNNTIWIYSYVADTLNPTALSLVGEVDDPSGLVVTPRQITVDATSGLAFVNAKNGTTTLPDTVLTVDLSSESVVDINPVGFGPTGLVFDPIDNILYSSTFKTHSIAFWGLSDLRP